ncbi:MAG: undecaprenyldiphospho-muramoylpentapeptide beta-N-acetylglucosaminyltransferase [Ginsengibacter sp.]|jgi:UDP-N-acetylglucosamine--N-acetylmuramyl-(pentapeptide) pyrophosphoryl-undecaprenol N-acetylglucosamine transferase
MINENALNNENEVAPEMGQAIRIIIAGGGTGGHIFPALAIAGALQKLNPAVEILFVGAKGKMEMEKIPEAGYKITGIDISGYNRSSLIKNISLPFKLLKSYFQVRDIFKSFKPHAVIGVGGYSTYPVLRLAQNKGIPTFIHEANSLGGKSNVLLAKRAQKIFVASEGMGKYFPENKIMVTGNPVRQVFLETVDKAAALKFFGLKSGLKTVFVFGGSLGAQSINETIEANIGEFNKNNLQLIWQTGKDFSTRAASIEEENSNMWTNAFITKMENAYAAADIVVCRAGAMTVAEICVVKKAAVFVPFPYAAEDHQTVNAMALVNKDAALLVRDAEVRTKLIPAILGLVKNEEEIKKIENNLSQFSKTQVDETIAREILNALNASK